MAKWHQFIVVAVSVALALVGVSFSVAHLRSCDSSGVPFQGSRPELARGQSMGRAVEAVASLENILADCRSAYVQSYTLDAQSIIALVTQSETLPDRLKGADELLFRDRDRFLCKMSLRDAMHYIVSQTPFEDYRFVAAPSSEMPGFLEVVGYHVGENAVFEEGKGDDVKLGKWGIRMRTKVGRPE